MEKNCSTKQNYNPLKMIDKKIKNVLANEALKAEKKGSLTAKQLAIIYKNKWFKMFVPKAYGGLQLNFLDALRLEEALAQIDGSLGWTVTLCSGANMFVGYIQRAIAKEIFNNEKVCFGGSGAATGTAEITSDGYIVNGNWRFATGTPHLNYFTANCKILKKGKPVLNNDGSEKTASFFFKSKEVSFINDWNTMGLKATASHSFGVHNLHVAKSRCFQIDYNHTTISDAVYQYPFLQFAEATLAVNFLGMFRHFLNECKNASTGRGNKTFCVTLNAAQNEMDELSNRFYDVVAASLKKQEKHTAATADVLKKVSVTCKEMVHRVLLLTSILYPFLGVANTATHTAANRAFRDIFTASQHTLFRNTMFD